MPEFVTHLLLALGGYVYHLGKQYQESLKRDEVFIKKTFLVSVGLNMIAIPLIMYAATEMPDLIDVSKPLNCIILGAFGSSALSGFINVKKPSQIVGEDIPVIKPKKS